MIRTLVVNEVEKRGIEYKELAQKIGVSRTTISNFIHGKTESKFHAVLGIIRYLFPNQEIPIMQQYMAEQTKHENIRMAMEYASFHNLTDDLKQIVDSQIKSKSVTNREWAKVYQLDFLFKSGQINARELLGEVKDLHVNTKEMRVMKLWLEIEGYYGEHQLESLLYLTEDMPHQIKQLKDDFLKRNFYTRAYMALSSLYLWRDELHKSREYAWRVIHDAADPLRVAKAFVRIGFSYLYESYDNAIKYLKIARKKFVQLKHKKFVNYCDTNIVLISNFWGVSVATTLNTDYVINIQELAHKELKRGNFHRANEILNQVKIEEMNIKEKAYHLYYKGLITKKIQYFHQSLLLFHQCGNKFLAKLPLMEIKKSGLDSMTLDTINRLLFPRISKEYLEMQKGVEL